MTNLIGILLVALWVWAAIDYVHGLRQHEDEES